MNDPGQPNQHCTDGGPWAECGGALCVDNSDGTATCYCIVRYSKKGEPFCSTSCEPTGDKRVIWLGFANTGPDGQLVFLTAPPVRVTGRGLDRTCTNAWEVAHYGKPA